MSTPYFFFQPMLSETHGWVAFNWSAGAASNATGIDYSRCFEEANAASLSSILPLVANIKPAWLDHGNLLESIEKNQAVFVLPQEVLDNSNALSQAKQLIDTGYHVGIRIGAADVVSRIPLASFDHVSMTADFARNDLPATTLAYLGDAGFRKIATEVNSTETYHWLSGSGFELCTSAFLSRRDHACTRQPDLTRLKLLKLLSLVERDGDTREIEAIFREEPKLSYNLLRLVNSVAVGARTKISNFSQAIAILGRRQLQRWLQLLIYANNLAEGNKPNPLMQMAAARGRLLELLCKSTEAPPGNPEHCDNAFLVGLFSLLDVLINMPMNEILRELPLQDEVVDALGDHHGGILGKLLSIIAHGEAEDFAAAEKLLDELDITPETHAAAQISALHWAARINISND
mgnify:CR=1 FL=1